MRLANSAELHATYAVDALSPELEGREIWYNRESHNPYVGTVRKDVQQRHVLSSNWMQSNICFKCVYFDKSFFLTGYETRHNQVKGHDRIWSDVHRATKAWTDHD